MRGMKRFAGMSRAEWMTGTLAAVVLGLTLSAALGDAAPLAVKKTKAISNCRQIIMALKLYSSDHVGRYPDTDGIVANSNEVFRSIILEQILDREDIFGCPDSVFVPDNDLGKAPAFAGAVKAGENHWAMTAGLTDSDPSSIPFIFDNSATTAWPPKWAPSNGGIRTKGQAWSDDTVIVGTNDGGVSSMPLARGKEGDAMNLKPYAHTRAEVFNPKVPHPILDVEPAKAKP